MNLNMLVTELKDYISIIGKYHNVQYLDDYRQEVLLVLFEKGEDYILERKKTGKLKSYTYKVCVRMLYDNGVYYKKYVKPQKRMYELNGSATTLKNDKTFNEGNLLDMVNNFQGLDKTLLEHYILCRGKKLNLSKKSNISYSTICKMLKTLNEKIKKNYDIEDFYD
jgi:hypothetical protein